MLSLQVEKQGNFYGRLLYSSNYVYLLMHTYQHYLPNHAVLFFRTAPEFEDWLEKLFGQ